MGFKPLILKGMFLVIIMCGGLYVYGQSKLNYGLSAPQPEETLPKSAASAPSPVKKAKKIPKTILRPVAFNSFALDGGWELIAASDVVETGALISGASFPTSLWNNATVPGTVLTTLVDQGVYPDPYFGLNNLQIPDSLCRKEWWYRIEFDIPENGLSRQKWLVFNGVNYRADVWLNNHLVGSIHGAFKRGKFLVTELIKENEMNTLAVKIYPPMHPGIPHEESEAAGPGKNGGELCLDGPTFISSEGWDWIPGIRDRNIGIWQNVLLNFTGPVILEDPQVIVDMPLPDTASSAIVIKVKARNIDSQIRTSILEGQIEDIRFQQEIRLLPGETREVVFSPDNYPRLNLQNPRLWWPNGYGNAELYDLELSVQTDQIISDRHKVVFGVREFSYELTALYPGDEVKRILFEPVNALKNGKPIFDHKTRKSVGGGVSIPSIRQGADLDLVQEIPEDGMGPYLVIRVNGRRIFCRGGNWGMDDGMKRVSRDRLEPYFRLHREANLNMIRNWTGESTEEVFYELADEYGFLVWNDFWMSTEGFNLPPLDDHVFIENAKDVIKRYRNHPSIVIWCPRNEGYAPMEMEDRLATLTAVEDGTRHYHGNSRNLNLCPSGPWNYFKDPADYFRRIARGFSTELGTPSVPTAASMRNMMEPEDLWPVGDVWHYHDLHNGQLLYRKTIDSLYGEAISLDDFCRKSQMINYESHRAMFESWNSRLWNNTSGLLLWMTHPAWPSTVWQIYSWDYETFGSYYGVKKACEPVHIQMNLHDNKILALNSTLKSFPGVAAVVSFLSLDGEELFRMEKNIDLPANQMVECMTPEPAIVLPEVYLIRLRLLDKQKNTISQNDYWKSSGKDFRTFNRLGKPEVRISRISESTEGYLTKIVFDIKNHGKFPAIKLKLNLKDHTGPVLPAYISDGYFNLMPGESKTIEIRFPLCGDKDYAISAEGYNLMPAIFPLFHGK